MVVLFVNSCLSLSLSSLPRIDPTHRLTGRSQATTDAQDRVELVSEFAMPFYKCPDISCAKRGDSRCGSIVSETVTALTLATDKTTRIQLSFLFIR